MMAAGSDEYSEILSRQDQLSQVSQSSIFLLFPFGAGSSGVCEYVTVRVTTCRTLTLLVLFPQSPSSGGNDALHGVPPKHDALRGSW